MNRREFHKTVLAASFLPVISCRCQSDSPLTALPNIVILLADDMGYGDLACQNAESKIPTPNLDALAQSGMRFTDAHSSSGVCSPTRYSLLTGRYHWRGKLKTGIVNAFGDSVIEPDRITLPEMLRQKGYNTACIGKWHLGWNWRAIMKSDVSPVRQGGKTFYLPDAFDWSQRIPDGPIDHGFDYYFGDDVPNFPPYTWIENDRVVIAPSLPLKEAPPTREGSWETRPGPMSEGWRLDAVMPKLTEKAVEWIGQQTNGGKPFLLYFPWTSPHAPIVPAPEFQGKTKAGGYGDYMYQSDWSAGQILKALQDNGLADNTLVIFTSDNGPEHYAYDRYQNFDHASMDSLRGLKRDLWEGGHRVPFIVRWPGRVRPGSISDETICVTDLMATLADIVGYSLDNQTAEDSYSFLPVFLEKSSGPPIREATVHHAPNGQFAIRQGDWVYIDWKNGNVTRVPDWFDQEKGYSKTEAPGLLYNLKNDLSEYQNLYHEQPEIAARLKNLLEKYRSQSRSIPLRD